MIKDELSKTYNRWREALESCSASKEGDKGGPHMECGHQIYAWCHVMSMHVRSGD